MDGDLPSWMLEAACRNHPYPDMWFPHNDDLKPWLQVQEICDACPVKEACLEFAMVNEEEHGVWGGLTVRQRRQLRRKRRKAS